MAAFVNANHHFLDIFLTVPFQLNRKWTTIDHFCFPVSERVCEKGSKIKKGPGETEFLIADTPQTRYGAVAGATPPVFGMKNSVS